MISFPNAKINLGLNIVGKRTDGYHNIESCFYPIPWKDSLEVIESKSFSFNSYGLEIPGTADTNLCVKAYELLQSDYNLSPIEIHLLKKIPMGAGLGGGSADGAFTLKIISDLFGLKLSEQQLEAYSLQLGSDCPFFIRNEAAIAKGRGEALESIHLDLSEYFLAIHNPGIHVSTREAYAGVTPKQSVLSIEETLSRPPTEWKGVLKNDFEASIFPNHPAIASLKEEMYASGAIYASMTGSGSTVYGIFEKAESLPWKIIKL